MKPTPDDASEIEPPLTRAMFATFADEASGGAPADPDSRPTLAGETRHPLPETDWAASRAEVPAAKPGRGEGTDQGTDPVAGWSGGLSSGGPGRRGTSGKIEPGQTLYAKYLVLRKLGGGAMGDVWLVRHAMLKSQHALKVIVPNFATNALALMRFQREFEVMATLRHEHAVTIYDACIDEDGGYIDMEYVEGQTIHEILGAARGRPQADPSAPLMALDWVVRVLEQLCEVLQVAHDKGIVHRDLKPSNMMLLGGRPPGKEYLKVLDFGIAKIRDDPEGAAGREQEATENKTQGFIGTPSYGSPEQALGFEDVDGRADLYSVGIMLYEFVVGRVPFRGNHWQVMSQNATAPPPPFAEANPRLRPMPGLEAAILRVLSKKREERPQDARDLFEEIRRAAEATPGFEAKGPSHSSREGIAPHLAFSPPTTHAPPTTHGEAEPPSTHAATLVGEGPTSPRKPGPGDPGAPSSIAQGTGKVGGPLRRAGRIALTVASVALVLILILSLKPEIRLDLKALDGLDGKGPTAIPGPGRDGQSAPPKPADFERYWPAAYLPVEGYTQGMPWPEKVRRKTDQAIFVRFAEGIYLPESSQVEKPGDLAADGWPRVIVREGSRFLRIPGDTFVMGAWDDSIATNRPDAPAHPVRLTGFYLQEFEVTHGQVETYIAQADASKPVAWEAAFNRLRQQFGPDEARKYPASDVSRDLALRYGGWIGGQLPTEAQWEYAARSLGKNRRYVWGDSPAPSREMARIDPADATPNPVGKYPNDRTEQGIFDLTGNVQEMCRDAWAPYAKRDDAVLDPCALPSVSDMAWFAIRGGSYSSIPQECTTTRRADKLLANDLAENIGFRLVVECPDARKPW